DGPSNPQTGNRRHSLASQYCATMMYTSALMLMPMTDTMTSPRSSHESRKYAASSAMTMASTSSITNIGTVTQSDGKKPCRNIVLTRCLVLSDSPKSSRASCAHSCGNCASNSDNGKLWKFRNNGLS